MKSCLRNIGLLCALIAASLTHAESPNPDFMYIANGKAVGNWQWVLFDSDNWWLPLEGRSGKSKGGKITLKPTDYQGKGDAVQLKWSRKDKEGGVTLVGHGPNLSKFEHAAEMVLVVKVDRKPNRDVTLSLECGENCSGKVPVKESLKSAPQGEWFVLPVALNCFTAAGATLDKVTAPLRISTNGRLDLSIASVFIQSLGKDSVTCASKSDAVADNPNHADP